MNGADSELDKSEAATPHKLREARRRGEVARSAEVASALVFAAAVAYLAADGWKALAALFRLDAQVLASAAALVASPDGLWHLVGGSLRASLALLGPLLAVVVAAALIGNWSQTGFVFSPKPLQPEWNRLNPAVGLKRVLSTRTLFDAARSCAKLLLLGGVAYASIRALGAQFYLVSGSSPLGQARLLVDGAASLGIKLAAALALIALIDLAYTRREFSRRQRMSRRELKDEMKHREGDPRIRARLRELRREMLKRSRALQRTRDADVIVVNPTHVAVALAYRHGEMAAPRLVAKGAGAMAAAMRAIAARHRIPVVTNRTLARALYADTPIDRDILPTHFAAVARLMVWVMAMRDARRGPTRDARAAA